MVDAILYSTGCPKCQVLAKKLEKSTLSYEVCNDVEKIKSMGFSEVPVLSIYGGSINYLTYKDAVKYVNKYIEN